PQHVDNEVEAFGAGHQLARRPTRLATGLHSPLRRPGRVVPAGVTVATHLTADGRGRAVDQAGDPAQAEALGMTDLNGGAFFNAEFGIGHRCNTVPERSGVALSFCGRPLSVRFGGGGTHIFTLQEPFLTTITGQAMRDGRISYRA